MWYRLSVLILLASSVLAAQRLRANPYNSQQGSSRIIGGEVAALGAAPFMVSVQNSHGNHICGGVIIHDQFILTSASCVAGQRKENIKSVLSTNDWAGPAWEYYTEEIFLHCNFDKPLYHNDIALIKMQSLVAYDEVTQNISIAELEDLVPGEPLSLFGWGSEVLGEHNVYELKQLQMKYVSPKQCKAIYSDSEDLDDGHLCAVGSQGTGSCHGDTGGPLVDAKGRLVGISNWGVPCGYGWPDVFARLSYYNDWIKSTINGCVIT